MNSLSEPAPSGAQLAALPLESLDPSRAEIYAQHAHGPMFARLRREDPVHLTRDSPFGAFWSVTRYHDIQDIERDHATFSNYPTIVIGDPPADFETPMFIQMDPPKHTVQRAAVTPAVGAARLKDLEALIRTRVVAILDNLPRNETFDWVDRVSKELTTQMLATLFDFPWADRHLLPLWSDETTTADTVGADADMAHRQQVLMQCLEYFTRLWHERAARPGGSDFISLLAHNPHTRDMVDRPQELLGNLMLLIVGGNDTTRNSITGGLLALHRNPDQFDRVRAEPALVPNMVSEIIRWQSPVAHMRRTATRDVEFRGRQFRQGDRVVLWYASANRDEALFEDPEAFRVDRPNAREHLAFGYGIHRCLGSRVAELQLRILWEELLARCPGLEVVGDPVRIKSNFLLGYAALPVRIVA
ncbi:MAG: cytochrome P450 [Gammaproteobacteria bacterium]